MTGVPYRLRAGRIAGAALGYGGMASFVALVALQVYRWFRLGEWTHIGVADALRSVLTSCCVREGAGGTLAALVGWIEAPADWLGLHSVLEVVPASLALFTASIVGNWIFIYCDDRLQGRDTQG